MIHRPLFDLQNDITKDNLAELGKEALSKLAPEISEEMDKKGLTGKTVLSLSEKELMELGMPELASYKFVASMKLIIVKFAPSEVPESTQGKTIQLQSLPPFWREVEVNGKKAYFNTLTLEFQTKMPGATADEIENYDTNDTLKFLKRAGFKSKTLGRDILSVFKKEKVAGKRLLEMTYRELVSLKAPKEEARSLRLILAPFHTKATLVGLDSEDTCIWAQALGVSKKSLDSLKKHEVTGKKLVEMQDLVAFNKVLDIAEGDAIKVSDAVRYLNYENMKRLGMAVSSEAFTMPRQKVSPLNSLLACIPPDYYVTLAEALAGAKFVKANEMLEDAKKKWEAAGKGSALKRSGLTEEEAAAVFVYTYDFGKESWEKNPFRVVNKTLAERNTNALPRLCGYILHLLSALRKLPRWKESAVVYRGVEGPVSPYVMEVGSVLSWPAFTSTTAEESTVGSFIGSAREPFVFEIRGEFVGYDISAFSALGGECEVLLEPETMFRVAEVKQDKKFPGATRIVVDVIDNPPVIEDMVMLFNREKSKRAPADEGSHGKGITRWQVEEAVPLIKVSAFELLKTPPPYCTFREAFDGAGFGCTYKELEELLRAKTKTINREKRLSDTDALTVFSYTVEAGKELRPYRVVNKALAERSTSSLKVFPYIFHLLHALRKLPLYRGCGTLYRGIDGVLLNNDTHKVGNVLTWPAFTSTTYSKGKAYGFVMSECVEKKVVFEITGSVRGYSISDYSMYPDECEVLLEPENKFEITKIEEDPSNPMVTIIAVNVTETPPIIPEMIDAFMSSRKLPDGWTLLKNPETGETFYFNTKTSKTQKEFPEELCEAQCDMQEQSVPQQDTSRGEISHSQQKQGTKALPPHWEERFDQQTGCVYYANTLTKKTQWEFPKALPPHWEERFDQKTGRVYYANTLTKKTQCEFPTN